MKPCRLQLLGTLVLSTPEHPGGVSLGSKSRAFLALVAASGPHGISRGQLQQWLWHRQAEGESRNALRQALYQLRRTLGISADWLQSSNDRLSLDPALGSVDLWEFDALAGLEGARDMVRAAQLYAGDLAEGLDSADPDLQRWLERTRERVRGQASALLTRMATRADPQLCDSGIALGQRLLAGDPLHEGSYRALMRLYLTLGMRAKALQIWDDCHRVLRTELQTSPSAETVALAQRLRQAAPPITPAAAPIHAQGLAPVRDSSAAAITTTRIQTFGPPDAFPGYDHLLRGWQLFSQYTAEANPQARRAFEQVVQQEPGNVDAIAMCGWTHFFDYISGWSADTGASLKAASACAQQALERNSAHPSPHNLAGKVLLWQHQHDAALQHVRRSVALDPGSAYAYFHLADVTVWSGAYEEGLILIRRALQLDPNDYGIFLAIEGLALKMLGNLDAACAVLQKSIIRNPHYPWPYATLAEILAERGDLPGARQAAHQACQLNRRLSVDFAAHVLPIPPAYPRERTVHHWRVAGFPEYA